MIEYTGPVIRALSMEGRLTICNMAIEAGARAGMVAPDATTFKYLEGRKFAPKGKAFERAVAEWERLATDEGAVFDRRVVIDASTLAPQVTWGTSPGQVVSVDGRVPDPNDFEDEVDRKAAERALEYMGLEPGTPITDIKIDRVFIGSCTNGRIEDLRAAAAIVRGKKVAPHVRAMVVPGSQQVKAQAEAEGLDKIFKDAGFEWRESGCSMCLGMNADILMPGRAVRFHLQPQLRRAAGQGRPDAPGQPADGGGRGDRRPLRRHPHVGRELAASRDGGLDGFPAERRRRIDGAVSKSIEGLVAPLDRLNVDTDQIIPKQFLKRMERTGFGQFLFLRLALPQQRAAQPRFRAERRAVSGRLDPAHPGQLRLRLVAGARPVGAAGLRLPGRSSRRRSPTSFTTTA